MTFELNTDNLLNYLNENKLDPTYQKETDQIYILMKIKEVDVPIFFGVQKEAGLIQLLAYLPFELKKEGLGQVARMLHVVNKQLDMPGFGMDEKEGLMFYRSIIPCLDKQVNSELLGRHLGTIRIACDSFMYAIEAIVSGKKRVEDLDHG